MILSTLRRRLYYFFTTLGRCFRAEMLTRAVFVYVADVRTVVFRLKKKRVVQSRTRGLHQDGAIRAIRGRFR